jgi:pimeloyl-ACP methyl ester carboxylesterase
MAAPNPAPEVPEAAEPGGAPERAHTLARPPDLTLHWRARGPARPGRSGAPAVLLLHGLASNLTRWSEFAEHSRLALDHEVIRVDLRGHGRSDTRHRIGLEAWRDDLVALLDATGHERALAVGHSLGAQVALRLAADRPQRLAGLVLIDPVFPQALKPDKRWMRRAGPAFRAGAALVRALNALGLRRRRLPELDLRQLDEQARAALGSPQAEAEFIRRYSSTLADLRTFRVAHYLQESYEMFRPIPDLAALRMPALVILSSGATFASLPDMRALAARLPQAEIVEIECHHWPLTEKPREVREHIEDWVARRLR